MDEETLKLLVDLHIANHRQGPGSEAATLQALALSGIETTAEIAIADIGSGTGAATIPLLQHTKARVTAVELLPTFLEELQTRTNAAGVGERLTAIEADMGALPFQAEQFDAIWSEGAIYNIGFEKGIKEWKQFLKPGGTLVVSEITWLQPEVPEELRAYWAAEYPEVATAATKIAQLEAAGYQLLGYFPLSTDCWLDNYYQPLEASFADFLERHPHSEAAQEIIAAQEKEIALYKRYQEYVSYGVYIAKKL